MLALEFLQQLTGQLITRANIRHMLGEDQQALLQQEARLAMLACCSCEQDPDFKYLQVQHKKEVEALLAEAFELPL
jgi:hypothetical protein